MFQQDCGPDSYFRKQQKEEIILSENKIKTWHKIKHAA